MRGIHPIYSMSDRVGHYRSVGELMYLTVYPPCGPGSILLADVSKFRN